jgi:DNA repair ATPase RecN
MPELELELGNGGGENPELTTLNSAPSLEVQPATEIAGAVNQALTAVKTEELRSIAEVMVALTEVLEQMRDAQAETETFLSQAEAMVQRLEATAERIEEAMKPKESQNASGDPARKSKLPRPKHV